VRSARFSVEVDLYEVVREFTAEEILAELKSYHHQEFMIEAVVSPMEIIPRLLRSLDATQRAAEKSQKWDQANALCDLRTAIQAALNIYRGNP
jgi:hypothetical protein